MQINNATRTLIDAVNKRRDMVTTYLFDEKNRIHFTYKHLEEAVYSYLKAGGKSLRPAVLLFACGAVGGDEYTAIPAAAAVELYHTFTLVHDDIIDRDEMRRGVPTVHHAFTQRAMKEMGFDDQRAAHYGLAIAILTGDLQQGWAVSLLPDLYHSHGLPPQLALELVTALFRHTQITLINGETVDVVQAETPVDQLTEAAVLEMLWQKTGVLYEFTGKAGAAIGLKHPSLAHPTIEAMGAFTGKCGIAFQLQDDILGVTGDEARLGKAVGADIREGKRTVIVLNAINRMSAVEKKFLLSVLGDRNATENAVTEAIGLLESAGGVNHARTLANNYIEQALEQLTTLPESEYKQYLAAWAQYIVERDQ